MEIGKRMEELKKKTDLTVEDEKEIMALKNAGKGSQARFEDY